MSAVEDFFSRVAPSDDPNDQYVHIWVGVIVLLITAYLLIIRYSFGSRAV